MPVRGILLDLEGVVYQDDTPIAGAQAAVDAIRRQGYLLRFLTNTTTKPRAAIVDDLAGMDITANNDEVFTPARAAAQLLDTAGVRRIHVAANATLEADFSAFECVFANPEAVILGDLFTAFDWERLNAIFEMLSSGARLIALHRNRYCRRDGSLALDLGPFVVALEYATRVEATTVGKPSQHFFTHAVEDMGLTSDQVVMVGDDIEADIGGAFDTGISTIQVRTGKFQLSDERSSLPQPVLRIGSIADLPSHLQDESTCFI